MNIILSFFGQFLLCFFLFIASLSLYVATLYLAELDIKYREKYKIGDSYHNTTQIETFKIALTILSIAFGVGGIIELVSILVITL